MRAPSPCATPGCPTLTPAPHCPEHTRATRRNQAKQRRAQGDEAMDIYSTPQWRRRQHRYLKHHRWCACGCGQPATQADHVVPRRLLVALGVHDPDHDRWLQPLTRSCHSTKTHTIDVTLLRRWEAGEDAATLAEEAMRTVGGVG